MLIGDVREKLERLEKRVGYLTGEGDLSVVDLEEVENVIAELEELLN